MTPNANGQSYAESSATADNGYDPARKGAQRVPRYQLGHHLWCSPARVININARAVCRHYDSLRVKRLYDHVAPSAQHRP